MQRKYIQIKGCYESRVGGQPNGGVLVCAGCHKVEGGVQPTLAWKNGEVHGLDRGRVTKVTSARPIKGKHGQRKRDAEESQIRGGLSDKRTRWVSCRNKEKLRSKGSWLPSGGLPKVGWALPEKLVRVGVGKG